jgi:multiple sugar transport system substrate-binding protein
MKKYVVFGLTAILLLRVLSPLSAGGGSQAAQVDLTAPVTLSLWTHEDPNRGILEKELIAEFTKIHPNVTVDYSAGSVDRLPIAFAANQGPDLFNIGAQGLRPYITNGRLVALDPTWIGAKTTKEIVDRYMPGSLDWVSLNGSVYALPFEYNNGLIYLNKNIFRSAGLDPDRDYPKTWEDLVAVSEKIVKRDGDIVTRRGFDFRWNVNLEFLLPMVEQLGGALVSADGKTAVTGDDAWIQVFEFFHQWGPKGKNLGGPTYATPRTLFNLDNDEVAMTPSGLYQTARIKAANPSFYDSGNWMVIPIPVFKNAVKKVGDYLGGGQYYGVNVQSTKAEQILSWQLIDFFLAHPDEYLSRASLMMPTYTTLNSPTYKAIPYGDIFAVAMENARPMPFIYVPEMDERLKTALDSALDGEDPRAILTRFRREMQEIIDQNR